jgi:SAM-dependent methyltransferase
LASYFDDEENVAEYVRLAEGYDGREFMPVLRRYLEDGATVLELGMGPGKDLDILSESFQVMGSDSSSVFLERYRKLNPAADLVLLDAVTMDTDRRFDCVYSNKVLVHLTKEELQRSLHGQLRVLKQDGILFHSLWVGAREEEFSGLRFVYYTEDTFRQLVGDAYEVVELESYPEMEPDDSFYVVLRRAKLE